MMNSRKFAIWSGVCLLVAACETTGAQRATSPPDPEVIENMVRVSEHACKKGINDDGSIEYEEYLEILAINDMTPEKYCECFARTLWGTMTQDDLTQFINDANRYENIVEREPWKGRAQNAVNRCEFGVWPN